MSSTLVSTPRTAPTRRQVSTLPLVGPSVLVLLIWMIVPLLMTLWFSLQRLNLLNPENSSFAGLSNYISLLTASSLWISIFNTLVLVGSVLVITIVLGTLLAVLFNEEFWGRSIARLLAIAPFFVMPTVSAEWGICGVGLLEFDKRMRDALHSQDGLYTLVERSPERDTARVIGSITHYLFAPDNRQAVIDALANPQCRIVTLTITEGGYYYIEGSGEFDASHPTIQHDLHHPDEPIGVYGFLTAALAQHRQQGLEPFTVLSCDNLQGNGNIARTMLTTFAKMRDPALGDWVADRVAFPNCMVDRITPATTPPDIEMVREQFGIEDAFPVVAEPFLQWVVEDNFCAGRPELEQVGVQFTDDVHPYEMMKIRLLNASHLLIGYLGTLVGYTYVDEVMADPLIRRAVDQLMAEVTPTLQPVPGIDLDEYKKTLIERFANPKIKDQVPRLCLNSAAKMPKFVLGSLRDALQQDGAIDYMSLTIAAWFRYLKGQDDQGNPIPIDDPMADVLTRQAQAGGTDPRPLLNLTEIFGDLPQSSRFVEAVANHLRKLYELGTKEALEGCVAKIGQ